MTQGAVGIPRAVGNPIIPVHGVIMSREKGPPTPDPVVQVDDLIFSSCVQLLLLQ